MTLKSHNALWYANHAVLWLNGNLRSIGDGTIEYGDGDLIPIQGGPKNGTILYTLIIISPNINRFSNFFHCRNQEII